MPIIYYEGENKNTYQDWLAAYTQDRDWNDDYYGAAYVGSQAQWTAANSKNRIVNYLRGQSGAWAGNLEDPDGGKQIIQLYSQKGKQQEEKTGVKNAGHIIVAKAIHHDSKGDHLSVCCNGRLWHLDVDINAPAPLVGAPREPWQVTVIRISAGELTQAVTTDGWTTVPGKNTKLYQ